MRNTAPQHSNLRRLFDEGQWQFSLIQRAREQAENSGRSSDWINYVDICHALRGLVFDDCADIGTRCKNNSQWLSIKLHLKLCNTILTSSFPTQNTPSERKVQIEGLLGEKHPSYVNSFLDILGTGYLGSSLSHYPALLTDPAFKPANVMGCNWGEKKHHRMAMQLKRSTISLQDGLCQILDQRNRWRRDSGDRLVTVAVVGNSPDLLEQAKGEEIDAHDLVVRFNRISAETTLEKHTGKRTDIWVMSPSTPIEHCPPDTKMVMVSGLHALTRPSLYWRKLASMEKPLGEFEASVWYELVQRFNAPPSSGTLTIAALQKNRLNLQIQRYGFTVRHGVHGSSPNHHNDQVQVSSRHNWQAEVQWLRESVS